VDSFRALGLCLVSVFFTYGGYHMTINMGADVKNPQRNIPLAIFAGIAIIIVLYLLINCGLRAKSWDLKTSAENRL
jgi:basic amino acid/polyamine antiporter, APA family